MFVDFAEIYIKAGNGGDGAVSFRRERFVPFGGPDGGDGGKGGDVAFIADLGMQTLRSFKFKRRFIAQNGQPGGKKNKFGKNGTDLLIKVPVGTSIVHSKTKTLMAEINSIVEPVVIAKGGRGGFGNNRFKSSVRQSPRFSKPGGCGQEFELCLELKLLADVGLIGFPNVGKSTLISAISAAKPKIGNYAFTTVSPVLGVVNFAGNTFVAADIPGLIEGASLGAGLGHRFLKHVQKCRLLVHLVDVSTFSETNARFDIETINSELEKFDKSLFKKPQLMVASKTDLVNERKLNEFRAYALEKGLDFCEVSAATTNGLNKFLSLVCEKLKKLPKIADPIIDYVEEFKNDFNNFEVVLEDGVFCVKSNWFERLIRTSNLENFENLQHFQNMIKKSGVENKLKKMGIKPGDLVNVCGYCFEYFEG